MSEEEKKAIEYLKENSLVRIENEKIVAYGNSYKLILLNLIGNQQKEIEEKNIAINKMSKDISRQLEKIVDLETKLEIEKIDNKYNQEERDEETIPRYKIRDMLNYLDNTSLNNYEIVMAFKKMMKELLEDGDHIPRID